MEHDFFSEKSKILFFKKRGRENINTHGNKDIFGEDRRIEVFRKWFKNNNSRESHLIRALKRGCGDKQISSKGEKKFMGDQK